MIRVKVTMAKRSVGLMSRKGIKLQLHEIQHNACYPLPHRQLDQTVNTNFTRKRKTVLKIQEIACFVNKMEYPGPKTEKHVRLFMRLKITLDLEKCRQVPDNSIGTVGRLEHQRTEFTGPVLPGVKTLDELFV